MGTDVGEQAHGQGECHALGSVKDLTLWQWHFVLAGERDTQGEYYQGLNAALQSAFSWAGSDCAQGPARARTRFARQSTVRLASVDWHEKDGLQRTLEARTLLEGWYLQIGCAQLGLAKVDTIVQLKRQAWHWPLPSPKYLGKAECLQAELMQHVETKDARTIATAMLRQGCHADLPATQAEQAEQVELACGFLLIPLDVEKEPIVLLVRNEERALPAAAYLLDRLMPPLLMTYRKGQYIQQTFEQDFLPQARQLEKELDNQLRRARKHSFGLKDLEQASVSIADQQAALAEHLSKGKDLLVTLQVASENIELLLQDPLLSPQQTPLHELWLAPLRLITRQCASDLDCFAITQTRADRMLQSINTRAQVRSVQWERRITIGLGAFVAFELLQVFPELPLWARAWLSVLLPPVVVTVILLLSHKK